MSGTLCNCHNMIYLDCPNYQSAMGRGEIERIYTQADLDARLAELNKLWTDVAGVDTPEQLGDEMYRQLAEAKAVWLEAVVRHLRCDCSPDCTANHPFHSYETVRDLTDANIATARERIIAEGRNEMLNWIVSSLREWPTEGGDISVTHEVKRIEQLARTQGAERMRDEAEGAAFPVDESLAAVIHKLDAAAIANAQEREGA